ncbi:MAG: dipeptide epimerase [Pirellulaceae bacterium]
MRLRAYAFDLPLRHRFTISRGSLDVQPTLIVELADDEGRRGFGEATTNSYYGATIENMTAALETVRELVEGDSLDDPAALWDRVHAELNEQPFALCALDQAAHDLWGKRRGQPVWKLWGLTTEQMPLTNYTIGIDSVAKMVEKMNEFPGWPVYKIKLGTDDDLRIVRELRQHTASAFRVDANCGWTAEQTLAIAPELKSLNVEFIEQPLPADHWDGMRRLFAESALPLIADESCQLPADVDRCHGCFHGVNIKLVKCGGLTPARRMIERARELKMQVMVGCMTESSVGISAIAQLLPLLDYVDMDGALLLADDIASGVAIDNGRAVFPNEPGCGVRLLGDQLPDGEWPRGGRPVL